MICVVGLGKVGLPLVAAIANAKYSVLGIDTNDKLISKLNSIKKIPLKKNKSLIVKNSKQIKFVNCYSYSKNISTFFLIVPTPSKSDNSFSNKFILKALKKILIFSQKKKLFIILNSTISPGSINKVILPFIKRNNKKKSIIEFIYNPFFIALGNVLDGIINPKSLLFGYYKKKIPKKIIKIYDNLLIKNKPIFILNYEETEIAKIISNYRDTMRVSLANLVGLICNKTKNSNSDKILSFLSTRLSPQESYAGTPYGGPCWPRDNNALERSMKNKDLGSFSFMPRSIHNFNNLYSKYLIKETLKIIKNKKKITLLGLGYKSGTDEIVESFAYRLYKLLVKKKKVQVFNLNNSNNKPNKLNINPNFFKDFKKNLFNLNDVIIFTQKQNLLEFKTVKKLLNKGVVFIDYWRLFNIKNKNYYTFGNN